MNDFTKGTGFGLAVATVAYVWQSINASAYRGMQRVESQPVDLVAPAWTWDVIGVLMLVLTVAAVAWMLGQERIGTVGR